MRLVVDSSVVVHLVLAGGVIGPLRGHELRAPALLPSEVASTIRELAFRGELPLDQSRMALSQLGTLGIAYSEPGAMAMAALILAERSGWAKTYDAEYVALAAELDCPLVTVDARLKRGASAVVTILGPTEL